MPADVRFTFPSGGEGCSTKPIAFISRIRAVRPRLLRLPRVELEESFSFTAARRDHLEKTIEPGLREGKIVISDRYVDSTRVYQGVTRGDLRQTVDKLHNLMISKEPDLTFIIDMDPQEALDRGLARDSGEDRFEDFGLEFQLKLRNGFLDLKNSFTERCYIIDGSKTSQQISLEIFNIVNNILNALEPLIRG